jgi:hypothetical protein
MTKWQVTVFNSTTERVLAEHQARSPDRAAVRIEWGISAGVPIMDLPVTDEHLTFVNALLDAPLRIDDDQVAFLGEYSEIAGEEVLD